MFRSLRQHRYNKLRGEGFTRGEAYSLSQFKFKHPYIRLMRQERRAMKREAKTQDLTIREFRDNVSGMYDERGWKDAFAMMRYYRGKSIELGRYEEPISRKRRPADKGNVRAQKERYKAKRKTNKYEVYDEQGRVKGHIRFNYTTKRFEPV